MKVFLSWSGKESHKVALVLKDWLPFVIHDITKEDIFVSSEDIDKGSRWNTEIANKLENSNFGIICVTNENLQAPWLQFESGALSKKETSRVCSFLFNLNEIDSKNPLSQFQSTKYEKDDIFKLIKSLRDVFSPKLADTTLQGTFNGCYAKLKKELDKIKREAQTTTTPIDGYNEASNIIFPRNKNTINKYMEDIFDSKEASSIKIICYGTSSYGKLIELLYTNYKTIKIEVVLCSPNSEILREQLDKDLLNRNIKCMQENNVDVHLAKIPPTVRASLIYNDNNEPIWCAIQPYYIFFESPQFRGADFTPSIIANEDNPIILNELSEIFLREFKRLKES